MTKKFLPLCFLLFSLFSFASGGTKLYVFPAKKVVVERNVKGDILVVGRDVEVVGSVDGNVSSIGGNIEVRGRISGNCVSIGGGVVSSGGKVEGDSVSIGELFGTNRLYMLLLNSFFWILTIGFGIYFYGDRIKENAFEFADDFIRLFFFGFYSLIALTLLALISFALIKVGIGIVLFVAVFLVFFSIYIFSVLTIFYFFGDFVARSFSVSMPQALKMFVGLIVYQLIKFIPVAGFILFVVLISASFGATIYSRFGTFKPWFGLPRFWGE